MDLVKISSLSLIGIILIITIKNIKNEFAIILSMGISIIIFCYIVQELKNLLMELEMIKNYLILDSKYFYILLKIVGMSYITQLTSDICRDNGNSAIAGQLETFCKLSIAGMCLPMVISLFEVISQCVN